MSLNHRTTFLRAFFESILQAPKRDRIAVYDERTCVTNDDVFEKICVGHLLFESLKVKELFLLQ